MTNNLFLIAYIAGRTVAIDSAEVDSVVDIGRITPVPYAYRDVAGLAALRSRVVTVIDPRGSLGLPIVERAKQRAIITVIDGHHYAILVDGLEDVAPFPRLPLDGGVSLDKGWRGAGLALIERDGEPILVVDLRALVPGLAAVA